MVRCLRFERAQGGNERIGSPLLSGGGSLLVSHRIEVHTPGITLPCPKRGAMMHAL